jgi:hypothetical protein
MLMMINPTLLYFAKLHIQPMSHSKSVIHGHCRHSFHNSNTSSLQNPAYHSLPKKHLLYESQFHCHYNESSTGAHSISDHKSMAFINAAALDFHRPKLEAHLGKWFLCLDKAVFGLQTQQGTELGDLVWSNCV